jgi:hypothetical protein
VATAKALYKLAKGTFIAYRMPNDTWWYGPTKTKCGRQDNLHSVIPIG